jgi:hypothetical protein
MDQPVKTNRVALLCDIPGLWWGATRFKGSRVDYSALRRAVAGTERQIASSAAWLADRDGLDRFQAALRHAGYSTQVVPRGAAINTLIVNAALEAASDCGVIAIAASGGNYEALGERLAALGCKLEIWSFPVPCSLDEMTAKVARFPLGDQVLLAS